jgi:acetolactate synthase-1/2/3 large subunit
VSLCAFFSCAASQRDTHIKAKKKVIKREDLDAAVAEMMASKDSYLLEVMVERKKIMYPMIPTGALF